MRLLEPSLLLWRKGLTKDAYVRALPPFTAGHGFDRGVLYYLLFFKEGELMLSVIEASRSVQRVPALVSDRMGKAIREHALSSFQLSTSFFRAGLASDMSISFINPDLHDSVLTEAIRKWLYRQGVLALESERPVPLP